MRGKSHSKRRKNLADPGEIALDHVGWFVPDADLAAGALTALGFTVTPFTAQTAAQPNTGERTLTGTGNVCVMLAAGYLEILVHTADTPLGLEFAEALAIRAGPNLAAFSVADAADSHERLSTRGYPMRPLARFSRDVATAEGTDTARFTVARLEKGAMPEGRVQFVTHHTEAAVWQPRWLDHANGAVALQSMIVSTPDVRGTASRLAALTERQVTLYSGGAEVALHAGSIEVLPEMQAAALTRGVIAPSSNAIIGARLAVRSLAKARSILGERATEHDADLVVALPETMGRSILILSEVAER